MLTVMTKLCQQIWKTQEWPEMWLKYLIITITKKGDLKKCENYKQSVPIICLASKILLRIIINRMNPQAEEILTEEQAGFRKKRNTREHILNSRILAEKHIEHDLKLYNNFIDYKNAFNRVWHEGLYNVMKQFNIEEILIFLIESLYKNAQSAVIINGTICKLFKTTVGVGCTPRMFIIAYTFQHLPRGNNKSHVRKL